MRALSAEGVPEAMARPWSMSTILSGAIRPVIHTGLRLKEAAKLGFRRALLPPPPGDKGEDAPAGVALQRCGHISGLVAEIASAAPQRNPQRERVRESA